MAKRCPICGGNYNEKPALSRTDNKTPICPICGTRQALQAAGIDIEEQESIIDVLYGSRECAVNVC